MLHLLVLFPLLVPARLGYGISHTPEPHACRYKVPRDLRLGRDTWGSYLKL
jgi:hypothetical protein